MACGVIYASSLVFPSCGCSSPAAPTLSRNLLASRPTAALPNGLSGSPVCAAVSQPTHTVSTCHCDEHGKRRARSGARKCVCQPTCLPGSVGPTPPPACSDDGSRRRRNQRRTAELGEAVAKRSLELVALAS